MLLSQIYNNLISTTHKKDAFVFDTDGTLYSMEEYKGHIGGLFSAFPLCVTPGSFDPLHAGHREIRDISAFPEELNFFEVSIGKVDKPLLSLNKLEEILKQFINYSPVIITNAPRIIEKIGLLIVHNDDLLFNVGIDTITRMEKDYSCLGIQGLNAKFIVSDRIINGDQKRLQVELRNRVPCNCFRRNVTRTIENMTLSSTGIRNSLGKICQE